MWLLHINDEPCGIYETLTAALRALDCMEEYQIQHLTIRYRERMRTKR